MEYLFRHINITYTIMHLKKIHPHLRIDTAASYRRSINEYRPKKSAAQKTASFGSYLLMVTIFLPSAALSCRAEFSRVCVSSPKASAATRFRRLPVPVFLSKLFT